MPWDYRIAGKPPEIIARIAKTARSLTRPFISVVGPTKADWNRSMALTDNQGMNTAREIAVLPELHLRSPAHSHPVRRGLC